MTEPSHDDPRTDTDSIGRLLIQFLAWVDERPRTYEDAMDAWRTSCPRLTIWEDATSRRLVQVTRDDDHGVTHVRLTPRGRTQLERYT